MRPRLESITLDIDGITLAGIRQRKPDTSPPAPVRIAGSQTDHLSSTPAVVHDAQPRMLCLHGWLDNANSFVPMMPSLPAFDLVAIDLPGHGYSEPLPQGYALHELCYQVTRIIEALGWPDCHLVGHSLGGNIAPLVAVASPEQVSSLIMIEACGPLSEPAEALPARMARSLKDRRKAERFNSRIFTDRQQAIDARLRAARMAMPSARLIIDRQLIDGPEGLRWRFDPRWRQASPQYMSEEQVQSILRAITCPTLTVLAHDGYLSERDTTGQRLQCLSHNETLWLTGHHHLHMDTPEPVAAAINRFLNAMPDLGS